MIKYDQPVSKIVWGIPDKNTGVRLSLPKSRQMTNMTHPYGISAQVLTPVSLSPYSQISKKLSYEAGYISVHQNISPGENRLYFLI